MSRAVILGGAGFIGRWLTKELADGGWQVVVLDLRRPADEKIEWVKADARNVKAVASAIQPGDLLVHLCHSSIPVETMDDPEAELIENVIPYVGLLDRLAEKLPSLLVYSSTGGQIYGEAPIVPTPETALPRPRTAYAAAKLAMENFTRVFHHRAGLPYLILRLGNPYGPYQELTNRHGVIPALFRSALRARPFVAYGAGETVRDYVYVADAVAAMIRLLASGVRNETVNIGSGAGTSLSELIRLVEKVSGGKVEAKNEPIRPSDLKTSILDVSLLKKLAGFSPQVSLEDGLRRTWDYLRENEKA